MRASQFVALWACAAIAGFAVAGDIAAAPSADVNPVDCEMLLVRAGRGEELFYIQSPNALRSPAWRDAADLAGKDGHVPAPRGGYTLTHRVLVQAEQPGALFNALLTHLDTPWIPLPEAPGFWLVAANSVADAVQVADELSRLPGIQDAYVDVETPRTLRSFNDPGYPLQWHLNNVETPQADINAVAAWDAGYTGFGVTIGIIEAGWQTAHPDLVENFNSAASQVSSVATSHATSCAGVAAAAADNGAGGVGLAYNARISQLVYGAASDNAAAFGYRNGVNAIKSNSWGPRDDGTISYLTSVERAAIENAIKNGRGGRGTIFCWAAGNGGLSDRVDYDPYVSSRYTIAVGAIGDQDVRAHYNERGASMLVVAPSSGNVRSVYTTTAGSSYSENFGGTSAAAPLVAGAVALALQANPGLTWRDIQHILINSARVCDPTDSGWTMNAAGHAINYNYGFGAVDAGALTALAKQWANVGAEISYDSGEIVVGAAVPDNNAAGVTVNLQAPANIRIESFELIFSATTTFAGDLRIQVTAPSGTRSIVAVTRNDPTENYEDYVFTSLRSWDENSRGTWSINVSDRAAGNAAFWTGYRLRIHGRNSQLSTSDSSISRE